MTLANTKITRFTHVESKFRTVVAESPSNTHTDNLIDQKSNKEKASDFPPVYISGYKVFAS